MCFFVAQFAKLAQIRMRYWNSFVKNRNLYKENYVSSAFAHPDLLVLSEVDNAPTLHLARWGLIPSWAKSSHEAEEISNATLNARGETIFDKPSFFQSVRHSRCIIPVNGFYEWQHIGDKKQPYYVSLKDQEIFSLAVLYSVWADSTTGAKTETFSIITVEANPLMKEIHNTKFRMPLIIFPESEREWISPSSTSPQIRSLVLPYPDTTMQAWQINSFNPNTPASNNPNIIKPSTLF